jgi:hypothetical protein
MKAQSNGESTGVINTRNRVALSIGGVAIGAAIGVVLSSQLLLDETIRTTAENAAVSGVIAAGMFAAADYINKR